MGAGGGGGLGDDGLGSAATGPARARPAGLGGADVRAPAGAAFFAALDDLGLFGLDVADQTVALGAAPHAVGLGLLDAGGVALDADTEGE